MKCLAGGKGDRLTPLILPMVESGIGGRRVGAIAKKSFLGGG
ncbi:MULTISPECIES: hypothetical protein [unclassified Leptolyngbya]|nr:MULTISPECIES: hypothetical protein [unclassified Leptolyngbya]